MNQLEAGISIVGALASTIFLYLVAYPLGGIFLGKLSVSMHLRWAIGFNGCAFLALGFSHFGHPVTWTGMALVSSVLWMFQWRELRQQLLRILRKDRFESERMHHRVTGSWKLLWPLIFACVLILGPALTYPSGWDELVYHITLPMRWYHSGQLSVQQDLPYSGLPSLAEILFWIFVPIEPFVTPRLITWLAWMHGMCLFFDAIVHVSRRDIAWLATLSLGTCPTLLVINSNCYVESFLWMDLASILYILTLVSKNEDVLTSPYAIVVGLLIGAAMATKMTSASWIAIPVLCYFHAGWNRGIQRKMFRALGLVVATVCIFSIPFYLRAWFSTGNPFHPFFAEWFTTNDALRTTSQYHHEIAAGNFGMRGIILLPASLFALAFAQELFDGTFGWQWIAVLVVCISVNMPWKKSSTKNRDSLFLWSLIGLMLSFVWYYSAQQARFAIPFIAIGYLVAAMGLRELGIKRTGYLHIAGAVLIVLSIPWPTVGYYLDSWMCVTGIQSPRDYIRDGTSDSYIELVEFLEVHSDPELRYLTLFEHRLAYLPPKTMIGTPFFQSEHFTSAERFQTPEDVLQYLNESNIATVILTRRPLGPDRASNWFDRQQIFVRHFEQSVVQGQLQVVWQSSEHLVLSVPKDRK